MIPFKLYQHEQQSVGVRTNPFYLRKLVDPCGDQIPPPIRQAVSMPPPPICPFVTGKAIYKGYRRRPFVPVYGWECKPHEEIFHPEKDYIVMGVSDYFNTKAEYGDPINLFSLKSKRCYNNMYKHIGKYLNYFSNFYDADGELRAVYAHMKLLMDKYTDVLVCLQNPITKEPLYDAYGNVITGHQNQYPESMFIDDLRKYILNTRSSIFRKVDEMNRENYSLKLSYRNVHHPALQYNDYHASLMMRASVLMNLIIPLITHYMYITKNNSMEFILKIFNIILDDLCDGVDIKSKLFETALTNINKNANDHAALWKMQDIRGISVITHAIACMNNIIVSIMPKYDYDQNIIHFNYKSIINNTKYQVTDISYEFTFVSLSSSKRDEDNNSEFDKYESYLTKENEGKFLLNQINCEYVMRNLELQYGKIDEREIRFYHDELCSSRKVIENPETGERQIIIDQNQSAIQKTQMMLIFNLFFRDFGHPYSLRELSEVDYIKLVIFAKRKLLKEGLKFLPYILTGKIEVSKIKNINLKEKSKMENNELYEVIKNRYRNDPQINDLILQIIARVLASKVTIIDFYHPNIHGKAIPNVSEKIIDEVLAYISMI